MANNTNKKYKVNDFVTVTGNSSFHSFKVGTKLKVLSNTGGSDIVLLTDGTTNAWLYNRDITAAPLKSTSKNDVKSKVYLIALELINKKGATTTLEIKLALRKKFSTTIWNQSDVSTVMNELASENKFTFNDNGTYRTYNLPVLKKVQVTKVIKTPGTKKISRTKAVELMENSNGKFITVTFTKADGTVRTITCQYLKNTPPSKLGYIQVKDLAKMKAGDKKAYAQIDPRTVSALTTNGCSYDVK